MVYNGLLYGVLNWNSLTTAQFDYLQSWADTEYSDAYFDDLESYFEDYTPPVPPDLADWVLTQDCLLYTSRCV